METEAGVTNHQCHQERTGWTEGPESVVFQTEERQLAQPAAPRGPPWVGALQDGSARAPTWWRQSSHWSGEGVEWCVDTK